MIWRDGQFQSDTKYFEFPSNRNEIWDTSRNHLMFGESKLGEDSVSAEVFLTSCYVCGVHKQQAVVCCLRVVKANNSFKLVASIFVGVLAEGKQ